MNLADSTPPIGQSKRQAIADNQNMSEIISSQHPVATKRDVGLVSRAIRCGWDVPPATKVAVVTRMSEMVAASSVNVPVLVNGDVIDVERQDIANAQAIAAARILIEADKLDQADAHLSDKNARLDAGLATERTAVEGVILRQAILPPKAE